MVMALFTIALIKGNERPVAELQLLKVCPSLQSVQTLRADILSAIEQAARINDIDPHLLMSVIATESSCIVQARSPKGALGLMQLMPATARHLGVSDPLHIEQNISGGAKYLAELSERFDGDMELTLAAYNAGPTRVRRYGGVPPFKETENFVSRVMQHLQSLKLLDARRA
jgi:soluble lytic murein transglycosylase-like protein